MMLTAEHIPSNTRHDLPSRDVCTDAITGWPTDVLSVTVTAKRECAPSAATNGRTSVLGCERSWFIARPWNAHACSDAVRGLPAYAMR